MTDQQIFPHTFHCILIFRASELFGFIRIIKSGFEFDLLIFEITILRLLFDYKIRKLNYQIVQTQITKLEN